MDQKYLNTGTVYPFPAVIGMDNAKKALLVALVSPDVKSVLIQGITGSAKTTLVRSISSIADNYVYNIPQGISEEQLFGSIDIEKTLLHGKREAMPGILEKANKQILYADDVNLMENALLNQLLDSVVSKKVQVEREGLSWEYECDTVFFASMNILEDPLHSHVLDRFDICVRLERTDDEDERYKIVKQRFEFDENSEEFLRKYADECRNIYNSVNSARERYQYVSIPDDIFNIIAELCVKVGIQGHRGDIAMANVSKAIAALDSRDVVTLDDVKEAAHMCLRHRMTQTPEEGSNASSNAGGELSNTEPSKQHSDRSNATESGDNNNDDDSSGDNDDVGEDIVFDIGSTFSVIDFVGLKPLGFMGSSKGSGKHEKIRSSRKTGRYIRAEVPRAEVTDLAFDASMRAAAPYQRFRQRGDLALVLESSDLRQKVREVKNGVSIMFLVDASGSMGARKRMVTVKGAVFSLLQESYKNRDKVGLISFRKDRAEILLPFTKSVDFAYRKLKEMPTGGTTPLAAALLKAHLEVKKEERLNFGQKCYVVLMTDGRSNISISDGNPFDDAIKVASTIGSDPSAIWIVVDTGVGYPHTDNALRICERLNGIYLKLEELNSNTLAGRIKSIVGNKVIQ